MSRTPRCPGCGRYISREMGCRRCVVGYSWAEAHPYQVPPQPIPKGAHLYVVDVRPLRYERCRLVHPTGTWYMWLGRYDEFPVAPHDECVVEGGLAPAGDYRGLCPACGSEEGRLLYDGGGADYSICKDCEASRFIAQELIEEEEEE